MRFDVPTVGMGTLRVMVETGAKVLAVEADRTILIDQTEFVRFAQKHRISVVAVRNGQLLERQRAA